MMKRCQNCNFKNEGLLDYCWECGSRSIVLENAGYAPQSAQPTVAFRSETPTFYQQNQQGFNQNYNTNGYNYATNNVQTPRSSSSGRKVFLAIAGLFTFLLLFTGVGAATYYQMRLRVIKDDFTPKKVEVVAESEKVKEETVKKDETVKEEKTDKTTETVKKTETVKNTKTSGTSTTKSNTSKRNNNRESAELQRMWVDYNVKENGVLGMRIHVKFKAYNMKDMRSYLGIYFEKRNGTPLKTKNKKFASTDGQVAIYRFITPAYDAAVYDDVELFMPYDELNLGRGKFDLTMSVDVIYEKGGLIEHLKDYDFIYEER